MAALQKHTVIDIDDQRHVEVTRTQNGTVLLSLEDPHSVAITEMRVANVRELIAALQASIGEA